MINKSFIFKLFLLFYFFPSLTFSANASNHHLDGEIYKHEKTQKITAVVPVFFPPFYYTDNEGLPYGMAIEVLNEINYSTGYSTHFIVKKSWGDVFKAIDSGEAQVIPNLGITEERKKLYFFSKPYSKTEITVFTRPDNIIKTESVLANLHIGVVKKNIGEKIALKRKYKNIHVFDSIKLAFNALTSKKVDAIIYPKLITIHAADQLNIKHLIHDTNITLKTIRRTLAVSKRHPEIFKKLNASLNLYLKSQDYKDTYVAWYGKEEKTFSNIQLLILNITILIFSALLFNYFWKKKKFSIFNSSNSIWIFYLIAILITATGIITLSTSWLLYETSFNEQRLRLVDSVKSRARLIEAIARNDLNENKDSSSEREFNTYTRTLAQVISAHKNFQGFGETGEFTFARKNKDAIEFVLQQRHSSLNIPQSVAFNSNLAVPMRLALLGHSGTIVAKDYRGHQVLAAYEPLRILNMGIVAKIDLNEIREPFIRSAIYILTIAILISFFGSLLFYYNMLPVIKKIQQSEQRFHQLFLNNFTPALLVSAKNEKIIDANTSAIDFYGYTLKELCTYQFNILSVDPSVNIIKKLKKIHLKKNYSLITQHRLQNGEIKDVEILTSLVEIDNEIVIYCTILDITNKLKKEAERNRLEKELTQARKMEALGQLTGGIAHDFNNMLGVIMGYTELSKDKIANNDNNKVPGYLEQILSASNRAKELISSMMLFSRSGENDAAAVDISPLVREDIKMLRSIIPTSVDITSKIEESLPAVMIEAVKLQQLIMNLCINARDAMEGKGSLSIQLKLQKNMNKNCLVCYKQITGDWVELSVSDTGSGMSKNIVQHLFEPFFTTKEKGKGTGMGMAVVHGIIQDLNGHILIDTKIGEGSTIRILFQPAQNQNIIIEVNKNIPSSDKNLEGRILIVDDEESLSDLLGDMLGSIGYKCTSFSSSIEALVAFKQSPEDFDLIVSDQTMPKLTGLEMITAMREIRSDIPAIIATGFSSSINESLAKENNIQLLKKPLTKGLLIETVNKILESK